MKESVEEKFDSQFILKIVVGTIICIPMMLVIPIVCWWVDRGDS